MKSTHGTRQRLEHQVEEHKYLAGILSGIVIAVVTAVILGLGELLLRLLAVPLKVIGTVLTTIAGLVGNLLGYSLPIWSFLLLVVATILIFLTLRKVRPKPPEHKDTQRRQILEAYNSATIANIKFRWTWGTHRVTGDPVVVSDVTYCGECDCELDISSTDRLIACGRCGSTLELPTHWENVHRDIWREIELRARQKLEQVTKETSA